ncbi:hypothetical protein ILUMI_22858 [Ignelater luminosus]|uniref:DNA-directed RNA polymerase n=1 Tax=Ignelater luminosus TaxID=2038154 RepID=A0A8K0CD49_IGNLU|nr:hypothetical protein ILUMI_22858 [Ignelater luminosus]
MYRLLKFRKPYFKHLSSLPVNESISINNVKEQTCSLCQKLHNFSNVFVKNQSTYTISNLKEKKGRKKRARHAKKYAELLIVTNQSTVEQKASVKKLSPSDLKIFARTDFNLSELYKLKVLRKEKYVEEHTYHNLTIIENIPTIIETVPENIDSSNIINRTSDVDVITNNSNANVIQKDNFSSDLVSSLTRPECNTALSESENYVERFVAENENLDNFESVRSVSLGTFQPETLEDEPIEIVEADETKENKSPAVHLDQTAREEVITRTLAAYTEICSFLKMPQRGLNALMFHRNREKKYSNKIFPPIKNINVYNGLLKGFAAKSDYTKLKDVITYANEAGVKLNAQSYAAIFECLGRVNYKDNYLKKIRIHVKEAFKNGFTFDRIMDEAVFLGNQRAMVLKAMKSYDPGYVMNLKKPSVQYNNHLLNKLNHDRQLELPSKENTQHKEGLFTSKMLKDLVKQQIETEKLGYVTVNSIEAKSEITEEIRRYRAAVDNHIDMWEKEALEGFNRDLATLTARRNALSLEPYIRSIPARDFVQIIVDEAKKIAQGSETYSPTCQQLYKELGLKVYSRYKVLRKQKLAVLDKIMKIHGEYCEHYANSHHELDVFPTDIDHLNTRQYWQWTEYQYKSEGATILTDHQAWVPSVLQNIGKFLYHIVMHDLKVDVNAMRNNSKHKNYLPGFYTIFRAQGHIVKEEVKPHPILSKLYRASAPETLTFPANEVPMRCPPVPWSSVSTGGYLIAPCEMVRLPLQATSQKMRLQEAVPNDIYPSLDSLNQLAAVPWRVNTRILDVILEVFNSGGSSKLDVPEPPSILTPPSPMIRDIDKSQRYAIFRHRLQYRRKRAEMYSLWCDCLYRLSLASHFRNDIFWLPHNMDFRGRVYPIPPHLNHLGSDLARSMLVFAESRPLGPHGLDWLKLHLINLTGLMKRERVGDRLIFADQIMDKILDSADKPLTGNMWWAESEEPWQTLACCMEIAAAIRSPAPEKYRSHFPVHQDGSCNGLQHYAALGRDSAGAHSVNLTPSPIPQDVYSAVVVLVEQQRKKDAENGLEVAKILEGFVKRKVIKQTIMTTVYGVTRFGARLQIARQLKDIDNFPKDYVWAASSYLTGRTFESLRTMFTSTREIQDWFTDCARLISSVCGQHVEWVTPLGLPIVQPYNRYRKFHSGNVYEPFHMDKYEKPNVMKQKNAFPPNFIHSLDSSHMMLTSLHCERAGVVFVSVHDCYWTHPSTVPLMNKICREQFVALHSEPILEDLSLFLSNKYSYQDHQFTNDGSVVDMTKRKLNKILRQLPKTGDFDIKQVLDSVYFFS